MLYILSQITLPYDPQELSRVTRETAAIYIACGVDTSKVWFSSLSSVTFFFF